MGRIKTGPEHNPRNRIIYDMKKKGMSYNMISRELFRRGFTVSPQRICKIIQTRNAVLNVKKEEQID